jgi:tetratricopeptide (TPR) repeat protein
MLLYVRGNVYDQFSGNSYKNYKTAKDTSEILSKKAKNEKIPANKSKMDAATKKYRLMSDSLYKQSKMYVQMAESDYKKILEVNPDYLDAYFNLGALTNNKTTEIVEQMNALNYNAPDYDKKFKALKTVQDSILNVSLKYFDKALQLADNLPEDDDAKLKDKIDFQRSILSSMQSVYANLGDEKKTIEMKKRKESLGR